MAAEAGAEKSHRTFPITAFVAMGSDHVVANMFFLPAAIFAGVPDVWGGTTRRSTGCWPGPARVGTVVFVASSYRYLFLEDAPADEPAPAGAESAERC